MTVKIAAAPISWGVCEVPGWGRVLEPATVLGEMAELGIRATELGPPGYLPADPKPLLDEYGLTLVGGFLAVPLHHATSAVVEAASVTARQLAACEAEVLVLAAATGLDGYDERPELTDAQWQALVANAARVADVAETFGLRTVLHPHVGTYVEAEPEVERFVADSALPLCLDSGHLLIGGTDPVALAKRHAGRVGHVHLKDVRVELADRVRVGEIGYSAAVAEGLYTPLGDGDVDVAGMVAALRDSGYDGWYVLEQDTALAEGTADSPAADRKPRLDTERSMRYLKSITGRLGAR